MMLGVWIVKKNPLGELIRSYDFFLAHRGMLKEQLWLQWVIGIVA